VGRHLEQENRSMSDRTCDQLADAGAIAPQTLFFASLPRIARHARFHFRHLKRGHEHDDTVAEAVALAWKWFVRLVQQGRHPEEFISAIASYAARAVKSGRRLCGQEKANDVFSRSTQSRRAFLISGFPEFSTLTGHALDEALHDNTATPVPDQVSFRMDFPAWLATRSVRDRELIGELIAGEQAKDAARRFGISAARVTQLRRDYLEDWRSFCDEPVPFDPNPALTVSDCSTLT
jgi:DNA-directed RNA polymerase specialized sigma24 family protein